MTITRCTTCGAEVPITMKFCAACGMQAEHKEMPETMDAGAVASEVKKKFDFSIKKFIKPTIVVAVVIVAIIAAANIFTPAKYERSKDAVYIAQGDDSVVVVPNGKTRVEIDGYLIDYASISLDGTIAAALIGEKHGDYSSDGYLLYLITDKPQLIDDGVYSFWLAASGNALAYAKEYESYEGTAELWYYSAGKNTRITSDFNSYSAFAISPDGKSIAFVTADGDMQTGYVWDGKINELGKDIRPIAISNGAKYIYYDKNGAFFVQRGMNSDNREKLGDTYDMHTMYANKDLSQIVYSSGSRAFISNKGGSRESLSGNIRNFLLPSGTAGYYSSNIIMYGISSFGSTFYLNQDDTVVYINSKFETNNVARGTSNAYLASNGKTLTYLRNKSIYSLNGTNANTEAEEIVDKDVMSFVATADGGAVFFVNDMDELYYQKGKSKPVSVSDYFAFRGDGLGYSLFKGNTLFYISDDELYVSTGGKGKAISGIDGRVRSVRGGYFTVNVTSYEDGDTFYYRSTDGNKFELISQDMGM